MKKQLEYFIRLNLKQPNEKEIKEILDIFHLRNYKKGDVFKDYTEISKEVGFIIEGKVRFFMMKDNGDKVTGRIVYENNFVTDFIGARTGEHVILSIEVIESTSMLVASIDDIRKVLETNLSFNILIREQLLDSMVDLTRLYILFLIGSSTDRYEFIMENNPKLFKDIPLHNIASMIGITPTQLSRIRNKKN